jgi:hypothetical protein
VKGKIVREKTVLNSYNQKTLDELNKVANAMGAVVMIYSHKEFDGSDDDKPGTPMYVIADQKTLGVIPNSKVVVADSQKEAYNKLLEFAINNMKDRE